MLFWIFVFILAIGIIILCLNEYGSDIFDIIGIGCLTVGLITSLVAGIYGLSVKFDAEDYMNYELQKYESLMYRYDHETDLVKRSETITEIAEWNDDVTWGRKNQHNFWYGFLIPDIYDELEYIELKEK